MDLRGSLKEGTERWRVGQHHDEICNVFSLPNIRVVKRKSHVAKYGGIAEAYTGSCRET
jgi:hypothetical protein